MALSGTFYANASTRWRLQGEWTAVQSISGNYSDVTLKVYWMGLDQYATTYTSDTKTGSSTINGSSDGFSFSAKLTGSQKKLIQTQTVRVPHNSDGTKTFSMSAYADIELTLAGNWVGRVSISSGTITLNTIPRASTLSSDASWTAGGNDSISISRASSSFTHTVKWQVKNTSGSWVTVKTANNVGSSVTGSFNTTENTSVFNTLAQRASAESRIELTTYNGSTQIGSPTYKTGTVTAPSASDVATIDGEANNPNNDGYHQYVYVDQTINIGIKRSNSAFTHTVEITVGSFKKTLTNVTTSTSWTPNTTEQNTIYGLMANTKVLDGNIRVYTYYNGVQVRSYTDSDLDFYVRESISKPTFSANYVTYADTNTATTAITGNNQYIIQDKSNLRVTISTAGTAKNGASISKYEITVNGVTKTLTSTGYVDIGKVNTNVNATMVVKVYDSRGFVTTVSKTVLMIPYSIPQTGINAIRANSFETSTTLSVSGTYSLVKIGTTVKNSITSIRRRYRQSPSGTWSAYANLTVSQNSTSATFSTTNVTLQLDNTKSWDVEVEVTDKLGTASYITHVDAGRPIFYMDADLGSIGFNDLPKDANQFLVNGRIVFGSTMWASTGQGENSGALFMNNSDVTGANGIYFYDVADNSGEGLLFLKSGKTSGSIDVADYDNFRVKDGVAYLNGFPIALDEVKSLWTGAYFMHEGQTVTPTIPLTQCPNGWILVWSDFDELAAGGVARNWDFQHTIIHKIQAINYSGFAMTIPVAVSDGINDGIANKVLYVNNTSITGHSANNGGADDRDAVLRQVIAW